MSLMERIRNTMLPKGNTVMVKSKWSMMAVLKDKDGNIKETREVNL